MAPVLAFASPGCDPDVFAELIERVARDRDRAAFARLFGWYAPRLKGHLLQLGAAPARAEDLAVEAMAAAWRCADGFDREACSADTWIYRIVRNLNLASFRREEVAPVGRLPGRMPQPPSAVAVQ